MFKTHFGALEIFPGYPSPGRRWAGGFRADLEPGPTRRSRPWVKDSLGNLYANES